MGTTKALARMVQVVATKFAGIRKTLEFDFDFDWRRGWRPRRNCWRGLRLRAIFRAAATSEKFHFALPRILVCSTEPLAQFELFCFFKRTSFDKRP